jgi:hypothetical protein
MKRTIALAAAAIAALTLPAVATDYMSKAEIAKLLQDKVEVIKQECARRWPNNFDMRLTCRQFEALKVYVERNGSVVR